MNDELTDIGRELLRLLTECRGEWTVNTESGWLENTKRQLALRDSGITVLLFVGGNSRHCVLSTADSLALDKPVRELRVELQAAHLRGYTDEVRRVLGLPTEGK